MFSDQFTHKANARASRMQQTVACPVHFRGRSLFHGYEAEVRVLPAPAGTGIVFKRVDISDSPVIPAHVDYLTHVPRRTALAVSDDVRVETVEHLMAALGGLQVDNCVVEISCPNFRLTMDRVAISVMGFWRPD